MKLNSMEETYSQACYQLRGITFVPHYAIHNIFVGPGYPVEAPTEYSAYNLERLGAKSVRYELWHRPK